MLQLLVTFIAQAEPATLPADLGFGDALTQALQFIGGLKGASALAISAAAVQIVMLVFRTKLAEFTGLWRWFIYSGLSLVAGVLAVVATGVSWPAALLSAPTMTALGNWLHQLPAQAVKAKEEKAEATAAKQETKT